MLIADDDSELRIWLLRAMKALGHLAEAVDGTEALLTHAVDFDPDAVLSDIEMGKCDGIAAGLWLRKTRSRCRIVLMTGSPERADEARRAGFDRVLDKPFSLEELAAALSP